MNIIVCIKGVPMTQELDLEIEDHGKDISKDSLVYLINDWDNYAVEEAVQLGEETGGTVTAISIGGDEAEEVLRRAQAMGADKAIRIDPGTYCLDGFLTSKILAEVIKGLEYDLVLTGVQADDDNCGMVGIMLAEHLGLVHAAVVTGIESEGNEATIKSELEGGMDEFSKIRLPALLSIQTGINEPRYVSIMGIKKASKKELEVLKLEDLPFCKEDLLPHTIIEKVYLPPEVEGAQIIEGSPSDIADEIIRILTDKGVKI